MSDMPHFVIDFQDGRDSFTASRSGIGILPSRKQSHPKSSCILDKGMYLLLIGVCFTIVLAPWRRRYSSMIVISSTSTLACSKHDITSAIDDQNNRTLPMCRHWVRCFDVSLAMPQFGHILLIVVSHRDCLLLDPHQPDTCFDTKIRNILG